MSPPVLARDETEAAFLAALHASPEEDATRLVYADWLEARGEMERADFLRIVCKLAAPNVNRKKAPQLEERLIKLSTSSDAMWRALVSRPKIEACKQNEARARPINSTQVSRRSRPG